MRPVCVHAWPVGVGCRCCPALAFEPFRRSAPFLSARLNFVNTVLSKRKLTWFVETGRVEGWNDPRMPTVQGILRRGMRIEALKEYILSQGASKNITFQEWDKIWTINKKLIDPVCPRHTAIEEDGKVLLTLEDGPSEPEVVTVPRHKKYPPAGEEWEEDDGKSEGMWRDDWRR